jgi:hypothetical protein
MGILVFLKNKLRRIRKKIILRRGIKKIGGKKEREKLRSERIESINFTKELIKKDLVYSWGIGELRKPEKEDWDSIDVPAKRIPISFLNHLQKKYWGGNIYNEL